MKAWPKIALWIVLLLPLFSIAQNIPPKPQPPRLVNDLAGALSPEEASALERKLVAYDDSTSNQVAVVLIPTLNDYPIEEYALQLYRTWGIGNKTTNNGVLILAAIEDRKIRIETGYGLEGAVPDITANQIITNDIGPAFRNGDYYEGIDKATNSIMAAAAGEYKAPENYRQERRSKLPWRFIILLIILFIIFNRRNRGGGGGFMSRRGYRRGLGPLIFPGGGGFLGGGGFGGGGWSGGGGGGFGGFGGGSSGGGGASGSW